MAAKKVFISYSHDSAEHAALVARLAARLRGDGVECRIDQYVRGAPPEGWPLWMERTIEWAEFVLVVCTETYLRRVKKEDAPGHGLGATWEAHLIYQRLYEVRLLNAKFIPIIFDDADNQFIPLPLRGVSHYLLNDEKGYERLYATLTGQHKPPPELGKVRVVAHLPQEPRTPIGAAICSGRAQPDRLPLSPGERDRAHLAAIRSIVQSLLNEENRAYTERLASDCVRDHVKACGTGMSDRDWNVRFRSSSLSVALVCTQSQYCDPTDFIEDVWLDPSTWRDPKNQPPLHFPWVLGMCLVFGNADRFDTLRLACGERTLRQPTAESMAEKEHFVLNFLQGTRTSIAALENLNDTRAIHELTSKALAQLPKALGWIDNEYFSGVDADVPGARVRLLLSLADIVQLRRFVTRQASHEAVAERLQSWKSQILSGLTEEQRLAAQNLGEAVSTAHRLWGLELGTLHNPNGYPLGDHTHGRVSDAVVCFLSTCVRTRGSYSGVGWQSWRDALVAFGLESTNLTIRRLAEYAHSIPRPFSSRT